MRRHPQTPIKQEKADNLLIFIREYRQANKCQNPSYKEMAAFLHTSTSVINTYLVDLEDRRLIKRNKGKFRSIEVVGAVEITAVYCDTCKAVGQTPGSFSCDHKKRLLFLMEM